jgi:hypothetical protein
MEQEKHNRLVQKYESMQKFRDNIEKDCNLIDKEHWTTCHQIFILVDEQCKRMEKVIAKGT